MGVIRAVGGWHPFRVVLGWACRGLAGGFLLLQNFSAAISVSPHVCFVLVLILVSVFLRWCICGLGVFLAGQATKCLGNQGGTGGGGWSTGGWLRPPVVFIAGRPGAALLLLVLWWFWVGRVVVCAYSRYI